MRTSTIIIVSIVFSVAMSVFIWYQSRKCDEGSDLEYLYSLQLDTAIVDTVQLGFACHSTPIIIISDPKDLKNKYYIATYSLYYEDSKIAVIRPGDFIVKDSGTFDFYILHDSSAVYYEFNRRIWSESKEKYPLPEIQIP